MLSAATGTTGTTTARSCCAGHPTGSLPPASAVAFTEIGGVGGGPVAHPRQPWRGEQHLAWMLPCPAKRLAAWRTFHSGAVDQNLPPPLFFFQIEKPKSDTITTASTAPHI